MKISSIAVARPSDRSAIDVEQRRGVADRAWVRLVPKARQLDPVELVARQRQRVERGDMAEEIAVGRGRIFADLSGEGRMVIRAIGDEACVHEEA